MIHIQYIVVSTFSPDSCREAQEIESIRQIQGIHAAEAEIQARILSFAPIPKGTKLGLPEASASHNTKKKSQEAALMPQQSTDDMECHDKINVKIGALHAFLLESSEDEEEFWKNESKKSKKKRKGRKK